MVWQSRLFKPTTFKRSKKNFYGFDVETCDNNKKVYLIALYGKDYQASFRDIPSFLNELKHHRFRNSWIVASNLHFDLLAVLWQGYHLKSAFRWVCRGNTSDIMVAKTHIVNGEFTAIAPKRKQSGTNHTITFVDTWNYDKCSVEKMGELLHIPKLDKPACVSESRYPTEEEWKDIVPYNLRDAEISYRYMLFLVEGFERLGASLKITLAGTAMSLFRNKYLHDQYWRHDDGVLLEQMKGYYGGRTEAFERGDIAEYLRQQGKEKLYYYDFNSLYPSVMAGHQYPDPNSLHTSHWNKLDYIQQYEGMSKVSVFCPPMRYPLLAHKQEELIAFPTGSWTGWYCHNELRRALELGYTITKVHKTYWYAKTCSPFDAFVHDLYELRKTLKAAGDRQEKTVKLLLNSLYGKFGQRFINREQIVHEDAFTEDELSKLTKQGATPEPLGEGYYRIGNMRTEPSPFCIPIWASYITSYARLKLHDALLQTKPVYCDTDSVITTERLPDSKELGALKEEYVIERGFIVRSKFYGFQGYEGGKCTEQVKIKGLGMRLSYFSLLKVLSLTKNDRRTCPHAKVPLQGKSTICEECGTVFFDKFLKMKEALRRCRTPNEIIDVLKGFSLEDEKHLWPAPFAKDGWQQSTPLVITETYGIQERNIYKHSLTTP